MGLNLISFLLFSNYYLGYIFMKIKMILTINLNNRSGKMGKFLKYIVIIGAFTAVLISVIAFNIIRSDNRNTIQQTQNDGRFINETARVQSLENKQHLMQDK